MGVGSFGFGAPAAPQQSNGGLATGRLGRAFNLVDDEDDGGLDLSISALSGNLTNLMGEGGEIDIESIATMGGVSGSVGAGREPWKKK